MYTLCYCQFVSYYTIILRRNQFIGESMNREKCILVGAAPIGNEKRELVDKMNTGQYETIAIDGGFHFFDAYNRIPDLWIGDMDSVQIGKETFRQCKKY